MDVGVVVGGRDAQRQGCGPPQGYLAVRPTHPPTHPTHVISAMRNSPSWCLRVDSTVCMARSGKQVKRARRAHGQSRMMGTNSRLISPKGRRAGSLMTSPQGKGSGSAAAHPAAHQPLRPPPGPGSAGCAAAGS